VSILEYASPQPEPARWRTTLYNLRYVFITAYIAMIVAALVWIPEVAMVIAIIALTLLQGLFLIGMPEIRWPRPTRKRAMIISQMIAALVAAALTFGLVATFLSAIDKWEAINKSIGAHILWVVAIAWVIWLIVFSIIWIRQPFSGFARIYKTLIAGTILEVLITIPIDVQVRKRTSCWCDQGTFFAYVICTCVAFWSFGPGLVLLLLTRKLQREGYFSLCQKCGQDVSTVNDKRCTSCKARIPRNNRGQTL
jgi:hypothetical protein